MKGISKSQFVNSSLNSWNRQFPNVIARILMNHKLLDDKKSWFDAEKCITEKVIRRIQYDQYILEIKFGLQKS